ncbi:MAG: SDR family NAD(P)-dependent oxidoreductase [Pirellulales bacterium]
MTLAGKTAVVVGGGTGIGRAVARGLAQQGCKTVIGGRRADVLAAAAQGTSILTNTVDVADRASVNAFFAWAKQQLGEIDFLISAAGVNIKNRSMSEMPPEEWDRVMAINATGAYNCIHAVLADMRARHTGTIINISSVAGKRAAALGGIAYCASKFAVTALGTAVSNEVGAEGVRITNLYPGEVNTEILNERPQPVSDEHRAKILQPEEVAQLVLNLLALPQSVHVPELVIKPLHQQYV